MGGGGGGMGKGRAAYQTEPGFPARVAGFSATHAGFSAFPRGFSAFPKGFSAFPRGFSAFPGGFSAFPPGFSAFPRGFSAFPGGFSAFPGGFSAFPAGFSAFPAGFSAFPAGFSAFLAGFSAFLAGFSASNIPYPAAAPADNAPVPPLPLSIAIVCKDNAPTIGRTLESVRGLAAEIVAVDSGSTDGTIAMLEGEGARVIRSEWKGHIATKQMALDACTQAWVLALDSDESLLPPLRAAIEGVLASGDAPCDGYLVNRKVFYRGAPLDHAWQPERRLRLVRRGRARWTGLDPHDHLELLPAGGRGERGSAPPLPHPRPPLLAGDLRHDSIATFAAFMAKQAVHARTMAASLAAAGERGSLLRLVTSPPGALLKQLLLKQAWRDGRPGWLAAASTAAATLMKHIALVELTSGPPADRGGGAARAGEGAAKDLGGA